MIGCEDRLRNDLYCVEWGVKLYSNQPTTGVPLPSPLPSPLEVGSPLKPAMGLGERYKLPSGVLGTALAESESGAL